MMRLPVVNSESWEALEAQIIARYPKTRWRTAAILRGLRAFPWWKLPTADEVRDQTGGVSRPALHRRRLEAARELPVMAALPRLTVTEDLPLMEQRAAFGL